MSEAKFTKGPWLFHGNDGSITDSTKAQNDIGFIVTDGWDNLNEGYCNAHLIAAAPEMYEMLEYTRGLLGKLTFANMEIECAYSDIERLIAKARG